MMFAIIPNLTRKNAAQVTRLICAKLDELGAAYSLPLSTENVFSDTKAEFLPEKELLGGCEAVITVGGDGTIIHSAKKAAVYSKPVLGINAGRLAFMAGLEIHELDLLEKLITGDYSMDKRMMLKTTAADGDSVQSGYSMNDSTVMRLSRLSRISEINVDLDGRYFNRYLGDGLILSTPTGSTAYSLSAGGPVVDPKLECMILTPICSHSVFTRSLVLGDDAVLRIYSDDDGPLSVSCDGDEPFTVSAQGSITVEKADICASFIRLKNDSFVDILNRKMMKWNSSSHDELLQKLKDSGFDATQATVSRDIKELRLVKTMGANGQYKYAVTKTESDELLSKFRSIFAQSVVSADYAGNTIVIRCYTGMAQAACAAFDSMHWEGLVGTLAGDDTIFALCRSESYASQMKDSIKRLIEK